MGGHSVRQPDERNRPEPDIGTSSIGMIIYAFWAFQGKTTGYLSVCVVSYYLPILYMGELSSSLPPWLERRGKFGHKSGQIGRNGHLGTKLPPRSVTSSWKPTATDPPGHVGGATLLRRSKNHPENINRIKACIMHVTQAHQNVLHEFHDWIRCFLSPL